jgi:hypothetical protein
VTTLIFVSSDGPQAHGNSVEGPRQEGEIRLAEFLSLPEQAHDDNEIAVGKKRTPDFRHRDRIRHGGDDGYGKDADRKIGPPPEGYGPQGGGPRFLAHTFVS